MRDITRQNFATLYSMLSSEQQRLLLAAMSNSTSSGQIPVEASKEKSLMFWNAYLKLDEMDRQTLLDEISQQKKEQHHS